MKHSKLFLIYIAMASLFITACKSSDSDEEEEKPVNILCEGKKVNTYLPLDTLNSWTFGYYISGSKQATLPKLIIVGTITFDSKLYKVVRDGSGDMLPEDRYFREDATTKNIYTYYPSSGEEFLEIPAQPTLNQTWAYRAFSRKITSINATYTTTACSYTGLLEISEFNGPDLQRVFLFKRGLGLVYVEDVFLDSEYKLSSVGLK